MPRWEPDAQARLERAALTLFLERGYDATTVAQIADRAGLTKSTFFRHFADKREVLFGGQDILTDLFREGIRAAPSSASVVDCIAAALEAAAGVFTPDRRDLAPARRAVITANSELQERELLKRARMAASITEALQARGVDEPTAHLAAEVGVLAFGIAYTRWAAAASHEPFTDIAHAALRDLTVRAATLGEHAPVDFSSAMPDSGPGSSTGVHSDFVA